MNVNLHIERLILDGLPINQRDAARVRDAIETELTQALMRDGLAKSLSNGGAFASVPQSTILIRHARADSIGQQIGRAVYGGVGASAEVAALKASRTK